MLTVDGRQADSGGVTLTELGQMMSEGGRLQRAQPRRRRLVHAASPASRAATPLQVENSPSDGSERTVPNGLGHLRPRRQRPAEGLLGGDRGRPAARAPAVDPVARRPPRTGLPRPDPAAHRRRLRRDVRPGGRRPALAHRAALRAAVSTATACSPRAAAAAPRYARRRGHAVGATRFTVLDPLARIAADHRCASASRTPRRPGPFGVVGSTRTARAPPSNPRDVRLDYDRSLFDRHRRRPGLLHRQVAQAAAAPGRSRRRAGGVSTVARRSASDSTSSRSSDFDDAASWTLQPGTGRRRRSAPPPQGHTGTGLTPRLRLHPVHRHPRRLRGAAAADRRAGTAAVASALDQGRRQRRLADPAPQGRGRHRTSCCAAPTSPGPAGGR